MTFTVAVTAPSVPGSYNMQRQMVQDPSAYFGDLTPVLAVRVSPAWPNNAAFVVESIPCATLTTGQTCNVSIRMKNTSAVTWTSAAGSHCFRKVRRAMPYGD